MSENQFDMKSLFGRSITGSQGKAPQSTQQTAQPAEQVQEPQANTDVTVKEPQEQVAVGTEQATENQVQRDFVFNTPLFDMKIPAPAPQGVEAIDTPDKFFDQFTTKTGVKVTSYDDVFSFANKINEYKEKETEYNEAVLQAQSYQSVMDVLPFEIKAAIASWAEGKDYRNTLAAVLKPSIDFNKDINAYKKDDIIRIYNQDITDEEYEDMDDKTKDRLYNAAASMYNSSKNEYISQFNNVQISQKNAAKKLMESIEENIGVLKSKFPNMSQDKIESVRKIMKTNYGQTLLDQGVYRKDAAVKIALAEYGEETFNEIQKAIKSDYDKMMEQAISQATEAYVKDKTNAVPPAQQTKQEAKSAKEYFKNQSWFSFRP